MTDYANQKVDPELKTGDQAIKTAITKYAALIDNIAGNRPFGEEGPVEKDRRLPAQADNGAGESFWHVIQEFIDAIPALVMLIDENHYIVASNKMTQQYLGKSAEELKDKYCARVVHGLDHDFPGCPVDEALRTDHWVEQELFDPASATWISLEIYPTRWRTHHGRKIFIHTARDITARKNAEERLRKVLDGTIEVLSAVTEVRDPYTADHARRVAALARAIAEEMGFAQDQVDGTYVAALLHDIGKLYIPAELLNKPRSLSEMEMNLIKMHPQVAHDILKNVAFPWPVARIVLQHHERVDGSGYPTGLAGQDILLEARALAVADVVEAMSSHRPYRAALGMDMALAEISQKKGLLYDAEIVDACLKVLEKGFQFR